VQNISRVQAAEGFREITNPTSRERYAVIIDGLVQQIQALSNLWTVSPFPDDIDSSVFYSQTKSSLHSANSCQLSQPKSQKTFSSSRPYPPAQPSTFLPSFPASLYSNSSSPAVVCPSLRRSGEGFGCYRDYWRWICGGFWRCGGRGG